LTPEFWTRITILIDLPFFSASSIASAFARSHNLILEEVIITRYTWTATNDEHERARAMSVMQIINPHIHRCRAISFSVLFSSSLPSFPDDFHGTAKHLTSVKLRCVEDDGGAPADAGELSLSTIHDEPLQCPNLGELTIDGRNYFNECQRNVNWTEMFPTVSALSISHFTPVAIRSESFTSSELMLSIVPFRHRLKSFSINDVHLDESPTPMLDDNGDDEFGYYFNLEMTALNNMHSTHCVTQILDFFGWIPDVQITRCCLAPDAYCDGKLSLKEIDRGEDLVEFLRTCHAKNLVIDDCPGFGDAVLHSMTMPLGADPWSLSYCARYVQGLSILNCPDFSVSALKLMVQTRRFRRGMPQAPIIVALHLSGRVPDVSSEDREWFKSRLSDFSYDPIQ
jgi:hypothetical protein